MLAAKAVAQGLSLEEWFKKLANEEPTPDQISEVLEFAQRLNAAMPGQPRRIGKGLWVGLNITLSAEDIDENRCEMWGLK